MIKRIDKIIERSATTLYNGKMTQTSVILLFNRSFNVPTT